MRSLQGWAAMPPTQLLPVCTNPVADAFVVPALRQERGGLSASKRSFHIRHHELKLWLVIYTRILVGLRKTLNPPFPLFIERRKV